MSNKEKDVKITKELISEIEKYISSNEDDMICYTIEGLENIIKKLKTKYKI